MTLSQVPGSPSFRSSAVNAIAVIPLLSSDRNGHDNPNTYSSQSFRDLLAALSRYHQQNTMISGGHASAVGGGEDLLLVVPNSNLTRPGDWKYDETPLKNFHWGHGSQRMCFFDGRPYNSRMAYDRLINHELTRNWIDLCPHRRTAAVIGVLNVRDCPDEATLKRAEEEWQQWAERYSAPPYEVTAHGRDFERDFVVQRLFVFDSFDESNKVDVSASLQGASLVAFPPADKEHVQMMDVHMNVVINDLAVAIFRELEGRIRESDEITKGTDGQPLSSQAAKARFFPRSSKSGEVDEAPQGSAKLSISNLASVVSPDSKLAAREVKAPHPSQRASVQEKLRSVVVKNTVKGSSTQAQLLTPLDDVWDYSELNPKDAQEMMRREVGRREKFAADLSLLAGSPLDAYERYMKAAELCRSTCPDPLWYASALEGCVAAHIAMAEAGGFNVDEYLESSFQLPDAIMACAVIPSSETKTTKQDMSSVVSALCEDALNVLSRHARLACFRAELLLKLAWYCAEIEDTHIRCQWGLGEGCYGGDPNNDKKRWEMASSTQLNFLELKNKKGEDVIARNTLSRSKKFSSYIHQAVAAGGLDPVTRADVALRCASMCLKGLRPTTKPTIRDRPEARLPFNRKASFFAMVAAEAMSEISGDTADDRTSALWTHAARLMSNKGNESDIGSYGWATLRAVALHGLAMQGLRETSEDAAVQLLSLMGEIAPPRRSDDSSLFFSKFDEEMESSNNLDDSVHSDSANESVFAAGESVVSAARTYVRETRAKVAEARRANFFQGVAKDSSLLTVAQSKWVEDDEIPTILLPMAEFSEISESIIAMRSVWSAIKFENCFSAQKRVVKEISDLREKVPASSFPMDVAHSKKSYSLPIKIMSIVMVESEAQSKLERIKVKNKEENAGAMATFFNPYANKGPEEATIVPEEEERYIMVTFANDLSIPLEIPRCQLEFNTSQNDRIKAPAISFVIPGQTRDFAVQFPFIILQEKNENAELTGTFDIKGLHLTCLARSFFLPLKTTQVLSNLPDPASVYPRRDYKGTKSESGDTIRSPQIEVVPAQPNLLVSFASSPAPIDEDAVIPVPMADGEVFPLPKLYLSNDPGIRGLGKIEELKITASGLPGYSEMVLFDLNPTSNLPEEPDKEEASRLAKKKQEARPLTLSARYTGMDGGILNDPKQARASSLSLELRATPDMGAHIRSCTVKLRFRYRGKAPSPTMEVWRKREIEVRILRIKGPRVSSMTFRPDLSWESAYSQLCPALSRQDKHTRYRPSKIQNELALPQSGSTDDAEFVANRLGYDPGVHVCGEKVVALVSVANESAAAILLSSPNGPLGGFEGTTMETLRVMPGVSAKVPIILPRVDRAPGIDQQVLSMTKLDWKSEVLESDVEASTETGGTIVPVNRRLRSGSIEIPLPCLKTIIDENPTFLSRICRSPCSIIVGLVGRDETAPFEVATEKPVNVTVDIDLASWVPDAVLKETKQTLEFCCARKRTIESSEEAEKQPRDYVWVGHIRKSLGGSKDISRKHNHRARLFFLNEGDYVVSACLSFSRTDVEDDVKEIWWAEKAQHVRVKRSPTSQ